MSDRRRPDDWIYRLTIAYFSRCLLASISPHHKSKDFSRSVINCCRHWGHGYRLNLFQLLPDLQDCLIDTLKLERAILQCAHLAGKPLGRCELIAGTSEPVL